VLFFVKQEVVLDAVQMKELVDSILIPIQVFSIAGLLAVCTLLGVLIVVVWFK